MKRTLTVAILVLSLVSFCACQTYEDFADAFLRGDSEETTIKIGVMEPTSGSYEKEGKLEIRGIELAYEEKSEILGKEIELVYVDNGSDIELAKEAAEQITEKDVSVVLGSYDSALSIAAGEVFQEQQQPAIAATCGNPLVTNTCEYYFRTCFVEVFQGNAVAQYAKDVLGAENAAVLNASGDDYALTVSKNFGDQFKELGGEIVLETEYNKDAKSIKTQLEQISTSGADVIFLPSNLDTALKIIKEAVDLGVSSKFLGTSEWDSEILLKSEYADISKQMYFSTYFDEGAELTDVTKEFLQVYKEKYNDSPDEAVVLAYDAYMLALDAIERAESANDKEAIREALANTKNFEGASGKITFNSSGDPIKSVAIMSVNNGKFESVYTIDPDF